MKGTSLPPKTSVLSMSVHLTDNTDKDAETLARCVISTYPKRTLALHHDRISADTCDPAAATTDTLFFRALATFAAAWVSKSDVGLDRFMERLHKEACEEVGKL